MVVKASQNLSYGFLVLSNEILENNPFAVFCPGYFCSKAARPASNNCLSSLPNPRSRLIALLGL